MAFIPVALAAVGTAAGATAATATVTGAMLVSTVAAAGVSAYGAIQQGRAAKKEANYSASLQDYNAKVQENNAITAGYASIQEQQNASREADSLRDHRARILGSQRAAAANAGLTISGSVNDVMTDTALESEKEIQMTLYRGRIGSYGAQQQGQDLRQQAVNTRSQASLTRLSGKNAKKSSYFQAGATLLSAGGSIAGHYASFKK